MQADIDMAGGRGPSTAAGPSRSVPVIVEKRWNTYQPSRVSAASDLISLHGLKPLYHAFVRPAPAPGVKKEEAVGSRVQIPQGVETLLAEQTNIPGKSHIRRPSLLPLHEACPPALLDPSFRMIPFEDMETLRDGMRLMPGRTDVNRKPKKRAGSPGEMSMSRKRKQLEQRRKENARFNNLTAPAAFSSPLPAPRSNPPAGSAQSPRPSGGSAQSPRPVSGSAQSPRNLGPASPRSGRNSRHASPAGSSHGSRDRESPGGGASSGIKIKLKLGGSPMPT